MKVILRIPQGWSKPVNNKSKEKCDLCGNKLWIGLGNQIYCDREHNLKGVKYERAFGSNKERNRYFTSWEKNQQIPIRIGAAGKYFGDKAVLTMAGKIVTIYPMKNN